MEMKKRSIAGCIILTFVTLGIYGIYWFVKLTNETNRLAPEEATLSGGLAFLATVCTLGIYGLYWAYKLGQNALLPGPGHYRQGACTERAELQNRETGERIRSCCIILNNR